MREPRNTELRAIKSLIDEENIEKMEDNGINLNMGLHIYHKTGRDKKKLNECLERFFEDRSEMLELWKEDIRLSKWRIETIKKLRLGIFRDIIIQMMEK